MRLSNSRDETAKFKAPFSAKYYLIVGNDCIFVLKNQIKLQGKAKNSLYCIVYTINSQVHALVRDYNLPGQAAHEPRHSVNNSQILVPSN